MNSKQFKSSKKKEIGVKSIVFWSVMGTIVLALIALLIVRICQKKNITSYSKVPEVVGQEIYYQKEDSYFVLISDFSTDEIYEDFNNTIFEYLCFIRDNKGASRNGAYKLYKFDMNNKVNATCVGESTNLTNTYTFPSANQKFSEGSTDYIMQVEKTDMPILVLVSGGQIVTEYIGQTAILTEINNLTK